MAALPALRFRTGALLPLSGCTAAQIAALPHGRASRSTVR